MFAKKGAVNHVRFGKIFVWSAYIPWVTPAIIGIPAITIWTRHYQRKFGELA